MIPDMLVSNRISYDDRGVFYHGPALHSVVFNDDEIKGQQNPYFYLGILNSKLFWFFIVSTSTALRGDAYRLTPEFLEPFCFPEIGTEESKQLYEKIITQVDLMVQLTQRLYQLGDKRTDERGRIEDEIMKLDEEIDHSVYEIYGITEEEEKVIEERVK